MIYDNITEIYHKFFRQNRMKWFEDNFDICDDTTILDVGGTVDYWSYIKCKPKITIFNIFEATEQLPPNFSWVVGDGRRMLFNNNEFDIVFSNSVIEHVKAGADQHNISKEILRVGKSFFVQTPYKYALVDSHYMTFLVHWLPRSIQKKLLRYTSVWGLLRKPAKSTIDHMVNTTNLLSLHEMKRCFPGSRIRKERFLFWPKALIAYQLPTADSAAKCNTSRP